jgi:polysaccharide export outer membrane protein
MRRFTIFVTCCVLVGCASSPPPDPESKQSYKQDELPDFLTRTAPPQLADDYFISVGDRLDIVFFFHDDLTTENLLVRSDGRITLPYVGDIMAAGTTPMHLDSLLTTQFSEILRDPNLSVIVREPATTIVYVLGEVRNPGGIEYENHISVVQAIAESGGFVPGAKRQQVLVVRRVGASRIVGIEMDLDAILKGHMFQFDFALQTYDIIYVPKTRIMGLAEFMEQLDDIIRPPLDWILRGWQFAVLEQQVEFVSLIQ